MYLHPLSDDCADSPARLARDLAKLRRTRLRGHLKRIATAFLTFLAHKKNNDTEQDMPLGDQVKLPEEFLKTISRAPGRRDHK